MKEDIISAMYKDKPLQTRRRFKDEMKKKYGSEINYNYLYEEITSYQIDKYGETLILFDPTWFEERKLRGKDNRKLKNQEYRKGNRV